MCVLRRSLYQYKFASELKYDGEERVIALRSVSLMVSHIMTWLFYLYQINP